MISRNFAVALTATAVAAVDPHEAMKIAGIVEGFFIGAFDFHGMTDIGHCLGDVNPLEEHLEEDAALPAMRRRGGEFDAHSGSLRL